LKARHLRAASEDLSSFLRSTDRHADVAAMQTNSDKPTSDRNARRSDPSENDAGSCFRFDRGDDEKPTSTSRFSDRDISVVVSPCTGENEVDESRQHGVRMTFFSDSTSVHSACNSIASVVLCI